MKFRDLLALAGDEPIFESAMLLAGGTPPAEIHRQLSRWVADGRLQQLRRGRYALAAPYAKLRPHPLAVAARLVRPSYVSLQSALSYHGLIPEAVPVVTSVTTARPGRFETPLGSFSYRHVKPALFWGYENIRLDERQPAGQAALVASPEKALVDLLYLTPGPITPAFIEELRLDPAGSLSAARLREVAGRTRSPRLRKAALAVAAWLRSAEPAPQKR